MEIDIDVGRGPRINSAIGYQCGLFFAESLRNCDLLGRRGRVAAAGFPGNLVDTRRQGDEEKRFRKHVGLMTEKRLRGWPGPKRGC